MFSAITAAIRYEGWRKRVADSLDRDLTMRAKRHCYWTRINARYQPATILRHDQILLRSVESRIARAMGKPK